MAKLFCSECGTPHSFLDKRPKFCTDCGHSFGSTASRPTAKIVEAVEEEIEDNSDYNIPTIDASELNLGSKPILTIGQAMASPAPASNFTRNGPGVKGLKKMQQDVATTRKNEI